LSPLVGERSLAIGNKVSKWEMAASAICFAGGLDDPPFVLGKGNEKGVLKTMEIEVAVENRRRDGVDGKSTTTRGLLCSGIRKLLRIQRKARIGGWIIR
jgi:hypothetical protein